MRQHNVRCVCVWRSEWRGMLEKNCRKPFTACFSAIDKSCSPACSLVYFSSILFKNKLLEGFKWKDKNTSLVLDIMKYRECFGTQILNIAEKKTAPENALQGNSAGDEFF